MAALFLDDNKTKDDGDGEENGKKKMFIITNNNFARASRYFVHFLCRRYITTTWNFLISRARLME